MAYANSYLLDALLSKLDLEATRLDLCSAEPSTFAQATSTYTLANKSVISISAPVDHSPTGREVTVSAITDGNVTASGNATHYAISDVSNSRLLVARPLSVAQEVTLGNIFTTPAFKIYIPGPS